MVFITLCWLPVAHNVNEKKLAIYHIIYKTALCSKCISYYVLDAGPLLKSMHID